MTKQIIIAHNNNMHAHAKSSTEKNGWIYTILLLLFGCTGVHRFYLEKIGVGIAYLLTFGFFGIGVAIDIIVLLSNSVYDAEYRAVFIDKGARAFIVLIMVAAILFITIGFVVIGTTRSVWEPWMAQIKTARVELVTENGKTIRNIIDINIPSQ